MGDNRPSQIQLLDYIVMIAEPLVFSAENLILFSCKKNAAATMFHTLGYIGDSSNQWTTKDSILVSCCAQTKLVE